MAKMKNANMDTQAVTSGKPLRRRITLWAPILLIVVYSLYRLMNVYLFPIDKLYVTGKVEHTLPSQIKLVAKENVSYGFFAVDLDKLRKALEQLRWVQNVSVRRVWPDALRIDIKEHTAVARWGQDYLINERGNLFIPDDPEQGENLPSLIGPPGMHRYLWGQYSELQSILNGTDLNIAQLVFDSRHAMRLKTTSGINIQLGRMTNVTDNFLELSLFAKAFRQKLMEKESKIASIDLRYTNGFAIEWRDKAVSNIQPNKHLT